MLLTILGIVLQYRSFYRHKRVEDKLTEYSNSVINDCASVIK